MLATRSEGASLKVENTTPAHRGLRYRGAFRNPE